MMKANFFLRISAVLFFGLAQAVQGDELAPDWNGGDDFYPGIKHISVDTVEPRPMHINIVRIDTSYSNLKFYSTSRCDSWGTTNEWRHSSGKNIEYIQRTPARRTRDFMRESRERGRKMVVAINAGAGWRPFDSGKLPLAPPSPACVDPFGLIISEGIMVSDTRRIRAGASFVVTKDGDADIRLIRQEEDIEDIDMAVSGFGWCLVDGEPVERQSGLSPKTGIGISRDRRYVYFITIDGRRPSSRGATYEDIALWLKHSGAYTGMSMDGGGSTTLARWDADTEDAELLNRPSDGWPVFVREREISNNIGVYDSAEPDGSGP